MARKIVDKVNIEVGQVFDCIESSNIDVVDDVADIVSNNAIDSVDTVGKVKRRVRCKAPFRAYLVKIGKAKFGRLKRNEANRMCVRKYLYDNCIEHGVLARHIMDNVDIATEMVFIPSASELKRLAVKKTQYNLDCKMVETHLGIDLDCN